MERKSEERPSNLSEKDVFIKDGNVFLKFADNTKKQITFSNSDSRPIYLAKINKILFVRANEKNIKKIIVTEDSSLSEITLADSLKNIKQPSLSPDHKKFLFIDHENLLTTIQIDELSNKKITKADYFLLLYDSILETSALVLRLNRQADKKQIEFQLFDKNGIKTKDFYNSENALSFVQQLYPQMVNKLKNKIDSCSILYSYLDSVSSLDRELTKLRDQILYLDSEINYASERLRQLNEFKIGRSRVEKYKQQESQEKLISMLQEKKQTHENEYQEVSSEYLRIRKKVESM